MSLKDIDEAIELQEKLIAKEKEKLAVMKQMRELAAKQELRIIKVTPDMMKHQQEEKEESDV